MKQRLVGLLSIVIVLLSMSSVSALDYFYSPMNFDSPTNHSFEINLNGNINVTLPNNFSLVSGSLTGINNISFVIQSPIVASDEPQLFVGTINLNGSKYEDYYLLSVPDNKIVDNKVEVGHGDFNYIDSNGYIPNENIMLFSLVRVWAMGSDILNEPATDVRFNCTYPLIIPNTVDGKYETTYNSNDILAKGNLLRMEGSSMFRVFVISQEINYSVGDNYEISCDTLFYNYTHTNVEASIPDFNLSVRSTQPLVISKQDNPEYVTYTIMNNETYDLRNLEFLYIVGSDTMRAELDSLDAGEIVQYDVPTNASGSITMKARFIPEWMFNSRSPTYYEQTEFDTYDTPSFLSGLNTSLYYTNQSVLTTPLLETQVMDFSITTLQSPPYGGPYKVTYYFYDESNVLQDTVVEQITGVDDHIISFNSLELEPNGLEEDYDVYTVVSILDDSGEWYDFSQEFIGVQTIAALTDNGAVIVNLTSTSQNEGNTLSVITGNVVNNVKSSNGYMFWGVWILIIILFLLTAYLSYKKKRKLKKRK